tara:strand:+ start:1770 stop:3086 length:1317 start_codon:yes stop_codon:yes gene_type:complete
MIAILGAGESGIGAAILAKKKGYEVFVSDAGIISQKYKNELIELGVDWEQGNHNELKILDAKMLVCSPGIPDIRLLSRARESGVEVISEIEFASRHTQGKMIAITGTNGKTTTASLVHHILKRANFDVGLAGNIGDSFARCLAKCDRSYWVIEVSSFQLENIHHFKPFVSILLNVSPDHLDRYKGEIDAYLAAKIRISENQTKSDFFIYWQGDLLISKHLKEIRACKLSFGDEVVSKGAYIDRESIKININSEQISMTIHELALQGKHNCYNSMASGIAAKLLGITDDIVRDSLSDFEKIEHRLEPVLKVYGVNYINDSKATNINAVWYALDSMNSPIVWICGGVDKGNQYEQLLPLVKEKVKAIVCLGLDNSKLISTFGADIELLKSVHSMEDAVKSAYKYAENGDAVLLSPACASFDLFDNYEDRGRQFKQQIRLL